MSPEEDRTRDTVDSEPKHYQLSYHCSISQLYIIVVHPNYISLWYIPTIYHCGISQLYIIVVYPNYISLWYIPTIYHCGISQLHIIVVYPNYISLWYIPTIYHCREILFRSETLNILNIHNRSSKKLSNMSYIH